MTTLIQFDQVSKLYQLGTQQIYALKEVTLEIFRHEFVAVVGKSGSGKSSLLNLIAGLDRPTSGQISVAGQKLAQFTRPEMAQYRAKQIGLVFQSFHLIAHNTAFQNVELPLIFQGEEPIQRRKKVEEVLHQVGLQDRMQHRPTELSGGERQRVAIARALVSGPELVLADEPTGNLDSQTAQEILQLFLKIHQEQQATILFITHDQDIAQSVSTRLFEMKDGQILKDTYSAQNTTVLKED